MTAPNEASAKLDALLEKTVSPDLVAGIAMAISKPSIGFRWIGATGNLGPKQPYFIASTTKLYTTTVLLQLCADNKLKLDTPISDILDSEFLTSLHRYKGTDYTNFITVRHLMAHTSGLPDYFQAKRSSGISLMSSLFEKEDCGWTFSEAINATKRLSPHFPPGKPGRAHYSDSNYQLLGRILETQMGMPLSEIFKLKIFEPLGLSQTYLYNDIHDRRPADLRYGKQALHRPLAMASFGPDGGIVSTADESLRFVEAFFRGELFPAEILEGLKKWNRIFFPLESGVGLHRFRLPWFMSFGRVPELIGHSGLSGAFAFYCPSQETYLAGTVNQLKSPDLSFRLMIRSLNLLKAMEPT